MALDLNVMGIKSDPIAFTYTEDDVILYALGVGSGAEELDFVYEKNLKVLPTFAVIPLMPIIFQFVEAANVNLKGLLHGDHKIVLHKKIPRNGTMYSNWQWTSVYDKGDRGALFSLHSETRNEKSELIFENFLTGWDRTAGNFGGEPGPKNEKRVPPSGVKSDFRVEYRTSPSQAALYRLSGDKNPLHIDPEFARKSGSGRTDPHGIVHVRLCRPGRIAQRVRKRPGTVQIVICAVHRYGPAGKHLDHRGMEGGRRDIHHSVQDTRRTHRPRQRHGRSSVREVS